MAKRYVIVKDTSDKTQYFEYLLFGLGWGCTAELSKAKRYVKRIDAGRMLTTANKHHEGWRVVPVES